MKYRQLCKHAKGRALDKCRDFSVDHNDWYEAVYEDAFAVAAKLGWSLEHIYFSGFWSQGDGACFTGYWSASMVEIGEVQKHAPTDEELNRIAREFEEVAARYQTIIALGGDVHVEPHLRITHHDRYYHERSVHIDGDAPMEEDLKRVVDASRDLMRWIYKRLEEEHEYLTSDEYVAETIEANDYDFDEEGNLA